MMKRKLYWTKDEEARLADERIYFTTKKVNQQIGFIQSFFFVVVVFFLALSFLFTPLIERKGPAV